MILIIDTSLSGINLLVNGVVKNIETDKQSLALPVEAEKFLSEQNIAWRDITAIAVVVGPGSFTGIRLGIAYAKGIAMGLKIPIIPVNAFEIYMQKTPDAFVAIDSKRGDFFVASKLHEPGTMTIDEVETEQMKCELTVGHRHYDLTDALAVVKRKLQDHYPAGFTGTPSPAKGNNQVIPMYLRPSYAELNAKPTV